MSQSLMSLTQEYQSIISKIIENGGELPAETEAQLANIETKMPAKVDAYAFVMDRLENEEEYWKAKAKEMQAVARGCENARDRIKENIKAAMIGLGQDELFGVDTRFKISNSKPKLVVDQNELTSEYITERKIYDPDTEKIIADLKAGKEVPGAHFEEVKGIRKYVNRGSK